MTVGHLILILVEMIYILFNFHNYLTNLYSQEFIMGNRSIADARDSNTCL